MKTEIVVGFAQIVALFFGAFAFPSVWSSSFKQIFVVVAANFVSFATSSSFTVAVWAIVVVGSLVLYVALRLVYAAGDPRVHRDGFEVRSWAKMEKDETRFRIVITTILVLFYLPSLEKSLAVIFCSEELGIEFVTACYAQKENLGAFLTMALLSMMAFLAVGVLFPVYLFYIVAHNAPEHRQFDAVGNPIATEDGRMEAYRKSLQMDHSPYKFLYDVFEHRGRYFKVWILLYKAVLVLVTVVIRGGNAIFSEEQAGTCAKVASVLVLVATFFSSTFMILQAPFMEDVDDRMDHTCRVAILLTAVVGVVGAFGGDANEHSFNEIGIAMVVLDALTFLCIIMLWLSSVEWVRNIKWRLFGTISFTSEFFDKPAGEVDFEKHKLVRVWCRFWDHAFSCGHDLRPPEKHVLTYMDTPGTASCLLNFEGTPAERFFEMLEIVNDIGQKTYLSPLDIFYADPANCSLRQLQIIVTEQIEGVDVLWQQLSGQTPWLHPKFGKLFVVPFPFTAVSVPDDHTAVCYIQQEQDLQRLVAQNLHDSVSLERKRTRLELRMLDDAVVDFDHTVGISKSLLLPDLNGKLVKRQIGVQIRFARGKLTVEHNTNLLMAAGFTVKLHLLDGSADEEGYKLRWHDERLVLEGEDLGLDARMLFDRSPQLAKLLDGNRHRFDLIVPEKFKQYREALAAERKRKEQVLSYKFLRDVYWNCEDLSRSKEMLQEMLKREPHTAVRELVARHSTPVSRLYRHLEFFESSRCNAFWFCYWDHIWD